jgi:hypothetical protein
MNSLFELTPIDEIEKKLHDVFNGRSLPQIGFLSEAERMPSLWQTFNGNRLSDEEAKRVDMEWEAARQRKVE